MKKRVIFAIARTEDYTVINCKEDRLTSRGLRRVIDLHRQLSNRFPLGEIRILAEGNPTSLTTLCSQAINKYCESSQEIHPFSGYRGVVVELDDSDSETIDTTIFYISYQGLTYEFLMSKWNDLAPIYGFRDKITVPPRGKVLALCLDYENRSVSWITESVPTEKKIAVAV